jgi:phenylalanyl-tRNA synthetase beta chain
MECWLLLTNWQLATITKEFLRLNSSEWKPTSEEVKPGASFAKVYGLDDTIIDIENKMFTHRPDLFGQLGVAREIAGSLGHQFTSPEWYLSAPEFEVVEGLELEVFNEAIEKVPRFMAVAMKDIEVKQSPLWLQCALVAMGSKPINNIVDVTNYIMLLTAQPVHAYDYDKLRGRKLGVRMAANGEKADLLNGKTYELTEDDIVIVDGEGVGGLGGIMGGGNSEVSADTKNIVLEVANFDMYTVRKSSMRHGVFTDALTRFNKGQSPLQNDRVLHLLMMSIKDVSSANRQVVLSISLLLLMLPKCELLPILSMNDWA